MQNRLFEIKDELFFWDQDVLNSYFDGNYFELENSYNFRVGLDSKHSISDIGKNAFLIHYQGSWKPWSVRGCYEKNSIFYQSIYKKLNLGNYHLEHSWRIGSLISFLAGIFKFKFMNLDYPYLFAKEFLIAAAINCARSPFILLNTQASLLCASTSAFKLSSLSVMLTASFIVSVTLLIFSLKKF